MRSIFCRYELHLLIEYTERFTEMKDLCSDSVLDICL